MTSFWRQWRRNFFLNLREFHGQPVKGRLIGEEMLPWSKTEPSRSQLRLARAEELIKGRDGLCRAAQDELLFGNWVQLSL